MGKMAVFLLGVAGLFFAAYLAMTQAKPAQAGAPSAPARTLENVRGAAGRIEDDAQRRADQVLERTQSE